MNEKLTQVEKRFNSSSGIGSNESSQTKSEIKSGCNNSVLTSRSNLRRTRHYLDATRTLSLPSVQVKVKDCKTELLNRRFSDGDLLSSPDLRKRKKKQCKICGESSFEKKGHSTLKKPKDLPPCPTKIEKIYGETMARSRSQSFSDTPDHLYGLDNQEFPVAEEADISVGKASPSTSRKKEFAMQTFVKLLVSASKKLFCFPLGALLLACLLGLLLKLQLPSSTPDDSLVLEKSHQETSKSDISQELKEIKEKLSLLSSKLNQLPVKKVATSGELAIRRSCNSKSGSSCGKEISHVLEDMVKDKLEEALETFTADRIGIPDYALESYGGEIHNGYHSPSYEHIVKEVKYFGWHIWDQVRSPRVVIQTNNSPGNCWPFKGQEGFIVIKLSLRIRPSSFTLEHIPASLSPRGDGKIPSAPKDFSVWGWNDPSGGTRDLLGTYQYDVRRKPLQTFKIQNDHNQSSYQYIELHVSSNYGEPLYTCIYRFRVHGKPMDGLTSTPHTL